MLSQLKYALVPHEYDTVMGRRIQKMKAEAMAKAAMPIVDEFFRIYRELGDGEGAEKFELLVCAGDYGKDQPDLYELGCQLEDLGPDFCANEVGLSIKRSSPTDLRFTFAKRTDPAPQVVSHYNKD